MLFRSNERMRIATLDGMDKIQAEFERRIREIDAEIESPDATPEQRQLVQDRRRMVSEQRQRDLDAIDTRNQPAQESRRTAMLAPRADSMASVGGFLGGERLGLQAPKTSEKLQLENNRILQTNVTAVRDLTEQVQQLASTMSGSVQ